MTDETGIDLSTPTETKCFICGVQVPNEDFNLHSSWHSQMNAPPSNGYGTNSDSAALGIFAGMPMDQVINNLATAIKTLQQTIGVEGAYRFLRDWSHP